MPDTGPDRSPASAPQDPDEGAAGSPRAPDARPPAPRGRRWILPAILLGLLLAVWWGLRSVGGVLGGFAGGRTTITHAVAVARMEAVAKLVSTETTLRDVVVYRNTKLGSTKRSLVVVTGKALVGIDLARRARVAIDAPARRITITLPHAQLIGLDVTEMKTYDESRGLWNWFHPEDRDTIYRLARQQLMVAARDASILEQAERNARQLLTALFAADGYTVDVVFAPFLAPPPPD